VIYESPKRVVKTVGELAEVCGPDRRVLVARELTKLHEETIRGTFAEMVEILERREARGEYVIVVEGSSVDVEDLGDDEIRRLLREEIDQGASRRDAVASVMARTGLPKRRIYDLSL
jgi:16S rRNA (cytidine1402-2'-O)-methyltransferase